MTYCLTRALLVPGILAVMVVTAAAEEPDVDCENPITQMDLTHCAGKDYEKADATLNELWTKVTAKAKAFDKSQGSVYADWDAPSSFEVLRDAQRVWNEYRDRQCDYEGYAYFGGTLQPMVELQCKTRLTEERNAAFRDMLTTPN